MDKISQQQGDWAQNANTPAFYSAPDDADVSPESPVHAEDILPEPRADFALFLDVDGTLAEIAATPAQAVIPAGTLKILLALEQGGSPIALISGRALATIDALTTPAIFTAAGQHGLELRMPDKHVITPDAASRALFATLAEEIESLRVDHPALLVENKGFSIAVHFRQAPELEALVQEALRLIAARHPDVVALQIGKKVVELRLDTSNKGKAIRELYTLAPFAGKKPVFIGDDVTDEDGFAAVKGLGGISIKVGLGPTQAKYRAVNPAHVQGWLQSIVTVIKGAS